MTQEIGLYWHRQYRNPNFGDELSPKILEMVSGRKVRHADIETCSVVSTGSLLWKALGHYNKIGRSDPMVIWGSGFMQPIRLKPKSNVHILLVRGLLSEYCLVDSGKLPHGDPGLLADDLFPQRVRTKNYRIGLIPHQSEKANPWVAQMLETIPGIQIVNINGPDIGLIADQISQCEFIISSSLHGLIVADSFRIPNIWLKLGDIHEASEFKFMDYFTSLNRPTVKYDAEYLLKNFSEELFDTGYMKNIDSRKEEIYRSWRNVI